MKLKSTTCLLGAALAVGACSTTNSGPSRSGITKANYGRVAAVQSIRQWRRKQHKKAGRLALIAIRSKQLTARQNAMMYTIVGDSLWGLKKPRLAFRQYTRAIELDGNNWYPFIRRAVLYLVNRRVQEAQADADRAVAIKQLSITYYTRGMVYLFRRKLGAARADFDRAIAIRPKYAGYWYWRGLSYHVAGAHRAALRDYRQALKLDPFHRAAQRNLRLLERRSRPRYRPTPSSPNVDKPVDL